MIFCTCITSNPLAPLVALWPPEPAREYPAWDARVFVSRLPKEDSEGAKEVPALGSLTMRRAFWHTRSGRR
jgi:hypothetical protein